MSDGRIIIDTLLDSHGLEQGLGSIDKIATKGLKIFTGAVVAAGTALSGLGVAGIKLASDLEEVQNVVDVTFGDNAKVINEWAKEAKTAFGMSELSAKQFNGTMGAMLKSMGLNSDEVLNMSTSMVGLAADFASFYNLEHEEAFNKIRAGISGETEPLKQLGINMSVANLEAYALTQGITKQYKEMSQAEQATLRYNYLMSAGADAQGDFARTSDSLANQMRVAKLNMQELGSEIGQLLLPVAQEAVTKFNELGGQLKEALSSPEMQESILKIADGLSGLIETVAELISEWLPKIIEGFAWLVDNADIIATGIVGIGTAMLTLNVANMIMKLSTAFKALEGATALAKVQTWLLNSALLANPIGIIVALVAGLVAAIVYLWNTNDGFRDAIISAWNAIKDAGIAVWEWLVKFFTEDIPNAWQAMMDWFGSVGDWFSELWENIKQRFTDGWNSIVAFFTESIPAWWESVKQSFVDGWQAITNFFTETIPALIESIFNWFNELPYKIGYALGFALGTIIQWGIDTWNSFIETCTNIFNTVVEWFSQLPGKISEFITTAYNNIVEWGTNTWNKFIETCTNIFNSVVEWFSKLPGKISEFITNAYNNIVNWGTNTYNSMVTAVSNSINAVINWFKELPGRVWEWLTNTISKLVTFKNEMKAKAREAGEQFLNTLVNKVKEIPGQIFECGKDIVRGLWNGITSMGSWISKKVSGFFNGIVDGAKSVLKINSPSKVFRDKIGKSIPEGVAVGIDKGMPEVEQNVKDNFGNLVTDVNLSDLTAKMTATVNYETAKTSSAMTAGVTKSVSNNTVTNNNNNGVTQNVTIVNPERTPSENARALRKVGRELAFG